MILYPEKKYLLPKSGSLPNGSFSTQITITETNVIYSEFDGYLLMFFAEPGQNYKLIFPPNGF
jgi:hypothetical protein